MKHGRNISQLITEPFKALQNTTFAKLYFAQTVSLIGDSISWVGLALLAYQIDPAHSPVILSTALTFRVLAFIIFSPFAGVLADRIDRKKILYVTHFIRMFIISCLPFVSTEWQIYTLVFSLNVFSAFFTPTYRSIIPRIVEPNHYREAVGLSTATFQLLGVLGPGLAGILAVWLGARDIFFVDAFSFALAAILILSIPAKNLNKGVAPVGDDGLTAWKDILNGVRLLFGQKLLRFALCIEFISAIAGANILVNTIGHIKNGLGLTDKHYGIVMAAFGIGSAIAAFIAGSADKSKTRSLSLISGTFLIAAAVLFANFTDFRVLMILWVIAGLGQSLSQMPSETLIGETIPIKNQGKVYGSHFAFSHLWWAIAYPFAGFLGNTFPNSNFLYSGILALAGCGIAVMIFKPKLN